MRRSIFCSNCFVQEWSGYEMDKDSQSAPRSAPSYQPYRTMPYITCTWYGAWPRDCWVQMWTKAVCTAGTPQKRKRVRSVRSTNLGAAEQAGRSSSEESDPFHLGSGSQTPACMSLESATGTKSCESCDGRMNGSKLQFVRNQVVFRILTSFRTGMSDSRGFTFLVPSLSSWRRP